MRNSTASAGRTRRSSCPSRTDHGNTIESSAPDSAPRCGSSTPATAWPVPRVATKVISFPILLKVLLRRRLVEYRGTVLATSTDRWRILASASWTEHRKARCLQCVHERVLLWRIELDKRRTHCHPSRIGGIVCDRGLERGDHRELLEHRSHRVERRLLRVRIRIPPAARQFGNPPRIDIAGRGNATRAAAAQCREKERFAAGEDIEPQGLKPVEHCLSIAPVAGAILDAGDRFRISPEQSLDQRQADRYLGYRWNVIQIHAEIGFADPLDDLRVAAKQAVG